MPPRNTSWTQTLLAQSFDDEQASPTLPDPAQAEKASKKIRPSGFTRLVYPSPAAVLRCVPMCRTVFLTLMMLVTTAGAAEDEPLPPGQRAAAEPAPPGVTPPKANLEVPLKYAVG